MPVLEEVIYMQYVIVLEFGGRSVEKVVVSEIGDVLLVTNPTEW